MRVVARPSTQARVGPVCFNVASFSDGPRQATIAARRDPHTMHLLATFYHAHPIFWTIATFGAAYAMAKGEAEKSIDQWREWHSKAFRCERRADRR